MKFVKLVKASEDWEVEKINENDWVIKSQDGTYKNSNGKDYHFKTKEDALEELDYLRAEHKFDKKSAEDNFKFQLTYDLYDALESVIEKIDYKASFKNGTLEKEEIMNCLEEACGRFEEFLDEMK